MRDQLMPTSDPDIRHIAEIIDAVRVREPLVHCITATVSMGIVADGLLAAGARPMMTETLHEAPVLTTIADALLINLGTLSTDALEGIPATVAAAVEAGHPWVLDPTAIGVAPVRTPLARELLESHPTVVRGNASEVLALAGAGSGGRGADSSATPAMASNAAEVVGDHPGATVTVSGNRELISAGVPHARVAWGAPMLTRATGAGCLHAAVSAAGAAATQDSFKAAHAAATWLNASCELAAPPA